MNKFLELANSNLVTAVAALGGVFLGKWLEQQNENKKIRREALIDANKAVMVWTDFALAKLPFELGLSDAETYLRTVSDKALEVQAFMEVIASTKLVLAYGDLRAAVSALSNKILQRKKAGKLDAKKDIHQFSDEPELELYRRAKRQWIDVLRSESGAPPVVIEGA